MQLREKIALVTGGTSGIGLASAKLLAEHGAIVIVTGRPGDRLREAQAALGNDCEAIAADLARPESIASLMAQVKEKHGRIDILVVSAGVSNAPAIGDLDVGAYATLMDVNCRGAVFTFVHALPLLAEGASVVFVGSVAGRKGQPGDPLYAGSKGFIRAFVRSAGTSAEILARRARVNTVAPGPIVTPLTKHATDDEASRTYVEGIVPMGRWGQADEVAQAVLFLASDASRYTTAAEVTVDGGMAHG